MLSNYILPLPFHKCSICVWNSDSLENIAFSLKGNQKNQDKSFKSHQEKILLEQKQVKKFYIALNSYFPTYIII